MEGVGKFTHQKIVLLVSDVYILCSFKKYRQYLRLFNMLDISYVIFYLMINCHSQYTLTHSFSYSLGNLLAGPMIHTIRSYR